jgi:hypothetical protein
MVKIIDKNIAIQERPREVDGSNENAKAANELAVMQFMQVSGTYMNCSSSLWKPKPNQCPDWQLSESDVATVFR